MLCERGFSAHGTLEDRFHETNRIGRMEIKLTDLILRRREAPSRRMAAGSVAWGRPSRRAQSFEARAPSGARAPQDDVRAPQDEVS
jgi:hypothetical protein